jgi:glycine/betaine/sarcosine/D-proline reductase family selenoprotein B
MKVVYYINQFFGGIGGEEFADVPPKLIKGPIGPGNLLAQILPDDAQIVATIVCGDNYAVENQPEVKNFVMEQVRAAEADLVIAGPCFNAGRYGMAAGAVCAAVKSELKVPVVTAMSAENPGVDVYRGEIHIVDSGDSPANMRDVLVKMATLGAKLTSGDSIGPPSQEGYLPQGILRSESGEYLQSHSYTSDVYRDYEGENRTGDRRRIGSQIKPR